MNPASTQNSSPDIRTFRAADSRSALFAIKAALGEDAVILETREVGGLFGKVQIEVVAASGPAPSPQPRQVERYGAPEVRGLAGGDVMRPAPSAALAPERSGMYRRLVECGIEEDLASELLRQAAGQLASGRGDVMAEVRQLVAGRLRAAPSPWQALESGGSETRTRRILALVGPTGVGKTTTVAKIAARALLDAHLKVALITVDTYRLGASDQLARYGKIMGIRAYVARDDEALAEAVAATRGMDLVLIDTAGRSEAGARKAQIDMLRAVPEVELHLVLSAATGAREIAAMARHYDVLAPDHLIFSKLDEADGPGAILSAARVIERPVSCITDGQRVPEDIHPVTGPAMANLIFAPRARAGATGGSA